MKVRKLSLEVVLSIISGRYLTTDYNAVFDGLEALLGQAAAKLSMTEAIAVCREQILRYRRDLGDIDAAGVNSSNVSVWLAAQVEKFGPYVEIPAMQVVVGGSPTHVDGYISFTPKNPTEQQRFVRYIIPRPSQN